MSQIIDETGNRYGHLTVIERAGSNSRGGATWLCRYDSGQDVVVLGTSLRTGKIQGLQYQNREHTGGVGVVDETGNRYGSLLVLRQAGPEYKKAEWLCRCDCGQEVVVSGVRLRRGRKKSCGCRARNTMGRGATLEPGVAAMNALYLKYRRNAKRRSLDWELTKDQFEKLTSMHCHYCGVKPCQVKQLTIGNGVYIYNGIDRVDNAKGYILGNIVPCCGVCNRAKKDMSVAEFVEWAERVYKHSLVFTGVKDDNG